MTVFEAAKPKHVVLLTVDCLRADTARHLSTLSSLMDEHVDVPDCQCTGSGTPTSMPGLFQSRLPTDYGGAAGSHSLVEDVPTLAEVLAEQGFDCGGWHSNVYTSREFDYQRGFDVFADLQSDEYDRPVGEDSSSGENSGGNRLVTVGRGVAERLGIQRLGIKTFYALSRYGIVDYRPHVRAERVVDSMLAWVSDSSTTDPTFSWGHFMDLHSPYLPPASYREATPSCPTSSREMWSVNEQLRLRPQTLTENQVETLRGLYEAAASYVDDQIARLVESLQESGLWDRTLLVLTADHGEMFADRAIPDDFPYQHPNYLCDYVTHVPLVLAGGGVPERQIDDVVSGMDVAPTIADAVGVDPPAEWRGCPLDSDSMAAREYVTSVTGRGTRQDNAEGVEIPSDTLHAALRTPEKAALWWSNEAHEPEFYDRSETHADPTVHERKIDGDAMPQSAEYVSTLAESFESAAKSHAGDAVEDASDLDEETTERLRRLGYLE